MLHQTAWPPQSLNLNPLEMVWDAVKEKHPCAHMRKLLQHCWKSIPGDYFMKLVESKWEWAVITAKGYFEASSGQFPTITQCIRTKTSSACQTSLWLSPFPCSQSRDRSDTKWVFTVNPNLSFVQFCTEMLTAQSTWLQKVLLVSSAGNKEGVRTSIFCWCIQFWVKFHFAQKRQSQANWRHK